MTELPVFGMPSRELDAAVAEYVMKLIPFWDDDNNDYGVEENRIGERRLSPYSTDISAAWEVAEKLSLNKYSFRCGIDGLLQPWASIRHISEGNKGSPEDGALVCSHHAFGISYAICLAALETKYANSEEDDGAPIPENVPSLVDAAQAVVIEWEKDHTVDSMDELITAICFHPRDN